jgi:ribosomal protein S6--L-glutamate ligase
LKIVVLSTNPKLYSTQRLVEAGKERGHKMLVLNHRRCYMNITTMRPSIHYKGQAVEGVDSTPSSRASAPRCRSTARRWFANSR